MSSCLMDQPVLWWRTALAGRSARSFKSGQICMCVRADHIYGPAAITRTTSPRIASSGRSVRDAECILGERLSATAASTISF